MLLKGICDQDLADGGSHRRKPDAVFVQLLLNRPDFLQAVLYQRASVDASHLDMGNSQLLDHLNLCVQGFCDLIGKAADDNLIFHSLSSPYFVP